MKSVKYFSTFQTQLAMAALVFIVAVSAATWFVVSSGQKQLIEAEAARIAEIVVHQSSAARSIYATLAVKKLQSEGAGAHVASDNLPGFVPLPAQFLRAMAEQSEDIDDGMYSLKFLSQWNLAPGQEIQDDFQRWAWNELLLQDKQNPDEPIDWKPMSRVDNVEGSPVLRYMSADPAASATCVSCHNAMELTPEVIQRRIDAGVTPGHQWNQHELMGAIEVSVPLEGPVAMAEERTRFGLLLVIAITLTGVTGVGLLIYVDSIRQRKASSQLEKQAKEDFLTTLPNRLYFESELQLHFRSDADQEHEHSVMLLDLDNFKDINDTLGHAAGDFVLIETAVRLRTLLRGSDFVARLGGDEFAILLPNTDAQAAQVVAQNVQQSVSAPLMLNELKLRVGVSIGIAVSAANSTSAEELLRCADVAMYKAKKDRSDFALYDKRFDNNEVVELTLAGDLKQAIDEGSLELHFQPKFNLYQNKMTGAEALLRWKHHVHGAVRPDHVVAIAERAGLMTRLTYWIIKESLRQCKVWRQAGYHLSVSVNLSAADLENEQLVQQVSDALAHVQLPSSALVVEVTESMVMNNPEQSQVILQALDDLGIKVSLDDYGTGYSSLAYLNKLPISELKLDRTFLIDIFEKEKNRVIVEATASLAKKLKIPLVSEGVEDEKTLQFLRACGCDVAQGYFLSCPMPNAMFLKRLPELYELANESSVDRAA